MDFYLIDPAGSQLHLPVNPQEVTIRREKQYETFNIINIGEVDFSTGEKAKEITFSSFFPAEYDLSYCRYPDIPDPQEAMNQLTAWMVSKKSIRLLIAETGINVLVIVSAHVTTFKGGEPGDIYYDLTCRTWREVKVRTTTGQQQSTTGAVNTPRTRSDTKKVPVTLIVKPGDSLWKIAKLQYGDGSKWKQIYENNASVIGKDPNMIYPGQKIVLPAV